jgi:SAM-dependent methyltransferase
MHIIQTNFRDITVYDEQSINLDINTVNSFGDEWTNFNDFGADELVDLSNEYFDILKPNMFNENSIIADFGCGSGRFSKFFQNKVKKIYAIDPSDAVFAANKLLGKDENVEIIKTSISNLPFDDDFFDFGMSIGVLHHIPDTKKALDSCVKKIKSKGFFYLYLYYDLENRGVLFRSLWRISNALRIIISKMPGWLKDIVCNIIAIFIYMPFVITTRAFIFLQINQNIWSKIPLSYYHNKSFFIIRNDSRDRFGTPLEQRFSKAKIADMMNKAGLINIVFSENAPFWHAVGQKS